MDIRKSSLIIQKQLNMHFGTDYKYPKTRVIKDPQIFFNFYTGLKKERSYSELIRLNSEVSFYYNDNLQTVFFKGFRRSGNKTFKEIKEQHFKLVDLLHEFIHHWQVTSNGYGTLNIFDEGCCETTSYVITGDTNQYSEYMEYIQILWNMFDIYTENIIKKYELIKEYNTTNDKKEYHDECINDFLNKYPSVAESKNDFIKQIEGEKDITLGFQRYCYRKNVQEVLNDLYKVHDYYKNNDELLKVFQ
jgi:hypothetical protein